MSIIMALAWIAYGIAAVAFLREAWLLAETYREDDE